MLASAFCRCELSKPSDASPAVATQKSSSPQNAVTSTLKACAPRALLLPLLLVAVSAVLPAATAASAETPASRNMRISFVPPPIEGTISLGIYDTGGKLVRVLHREADLDSFEIGTDALNTTWDGYNDAGEPLPAGKYAGRGYVVGEIAVEGVGFFFNDWVVDEQSPRITRISAIGTRNSNLVVAAQLQSGSTQTFALDEQGKITGPATMDHRDVGCGKIADPEQVVEPITCSEGKEKTLWVIDRIEANPPQTEVKQLSESGELLRRLKIPPEEPQPRQIGASLSEDRIFLLEENENMQRVRGLTLLATKNEAAQTVSDWKIDFAKRIVAHREFSIENGKPVAASGSTAPPEKLAIKLQPNPLNADKRGKLEVSVGQDQSGSFLKTADGLPLHTISETPSLQRVVLSPTGEKTVDVFQDDSAVVEQFRVTNLDQMMAFDCGDFELK
jgi:hypothetical protein